MTFFSRTDTDNSAQPATEIDRRPHRMEIQLCRFPLLGPEPQNQ